MTPITITLHGCDTARCGDLSAKASSMKSPINKLARMLIDAGADGSAPVTVLRGETECFNRLPLSWWAENTAVETDRASARFKAYSAMPDASKIFGGAP